MNQYLSEIIDRVEFSNVVFFGSILLLCLIAGLFSDKGGK